MISMKISDIYNMLDEKYNFSSACFYDNPGHLVGSHQDEVKGILVCLDCTDEAVTEAIEKGVNLIISHHPVIFDGLKAVTEESIVFRLIRNGISVISMHTNLDIAENGVCETLCNVLSPITLENVTAVPLQQHIFDKGRQVYSVPDIEESRRLCASQLESMWKEVLRWENPHDYYVDLSESLWEIKDSLLRKLRNKS